MKVPIKYKSSDRYKAGVDVVYDDESKLQYAPFIYASTQSGDNGPDEGGDEEGEDSMIVHVDTNGNSDVTYTQLKNAVTSGKAVYILYVTDTGATYSAIPLYLNDLAHDPANTGREYYATFTSLKVDTGANNNLSGELFVKLQSSTDSDTMRVEDDGSNS